MSQHNHPDADRAAMSKYLAENPEIVRPEFRASVEAGLIEIGMTPTECRLAGGAFNYHVKPDPAVWPQDVDPYKVMKAQADAPDASFIKMTFKNAWQFSTGEPVRFSVLFKNGRVKDINRD